MGILKSLLLFASKNKEYQNIEQIMKQHYIFTLSLFLFFVFSCTSESAKQETATDQPIAENTIKTSTEKTITSNETAVAVSETGEEIKKVTYDKEIELINTEIMRINENLVFYTKEERLADWETFSCELKQYKDENGLILKAEATCGDHSWEIYSIALSKSSSKLLYGKYLKNVTDDRLPTIREFYSIGSMIPSENAYTVIMDESGKEIAPDGYRTYSVLYEAAFDAFCYE